MLYKNIMRTQNRTSSDPRTYKYKNNYNILSTFLLNSVFVIDLEVFVIYIQDIIPLLISCTTDVIHMTSHIFNYMTCIFSVIIASFDDKKILILFQFNIYFSLLLVHLYHFRNLSLPNVVKKSFCVVLEILFF